MVGDRLDTDIEGAVDDGLGQPAGAHRRDRARASWSRAEQDERPTYIAPDLGALAEPHQAPEATDGGVTPRRLDAPRVEDGAAGRRRATGSAADWWRVVAVAAWRHLDDDGPACRDRRRAAAPVACRP